MSEEMRGTVHSTKGLLLGVFFTLLSFFSAATTNALVKWMKDEFDSTQILLCQNLFGLLVISSLCLYSKKRASFFRSHQFGLLLLRSMAGLISFFFLFTSVKHLPVSISTLLLNTAPLFIPFLLHIFLKEKMKAIIWLGIIPGFLGILMILKPNQSFFQWYTILGLLSGLCAAIIVISLRRLHIHKEPMLRILFYLFLFSTLAIAPFGLSHWRTPTLQNGLLLALTMLSSFIAQTSITIGMRYGTPKAFAPLCYTSVIFGLLFDWLVWHTLPSTLSFIGILLVILGGVIAILIESQAIQKHRNL